MDPASTLTEAAGRVAVYVVVVPLVGLVSWRLLLWPRLEDVATPDERSSVERRAATLGVLLALALLAALFARAVCQSANAFGWAAALEAGNLRTVAIESRWGERFLWQVWAAAAALCAFVWARLHARSGWLVAAIACAALALALPRTGHAMSHGAIALGSQTLHVLGAGLWIGTLAVALGAGSGAVRLRGSGAVEPLERGVATKYVGEMLRLFAPVAIAGAVALGASGALTAYLYLPDVGSLLSTSWGRALLFKVVLVICVGALGFLNFRRFRQHSATPSLRLAKLELTVALAVVVVTAILTALPSPGD